MLLIPPSVMDERSEPPISLPQNHAVGSKFPTVAAAKTQAIFTSHGKPARRATHRTPLGNDFKFENSGRKGRLYEDQRHPLSDASGHLADRLWRFAVPRAARVERAVGPAA